MCKKSVIWERNSILFGKKKCYASYLFHKLLNWKDFCEALSDFILFYIDCRSCFDWTVFREENWLLKNIYLWQVFNFSGNGSVKQWRSEGLPVQATCPPGGQDWRRKLRKKWGKEEIKYRKIRNFWCNFSSYSPGNESVAMAPVSKSKRID